MNELYSAFSQLFANCKNSNYDVIFKIYSFDIRLNDRIPSRCFIMTGKELYILIPSWNMLLRIPSFPEF